MRPPAAPPAPAPMAAPFAVRFHSAQPMVPTKNEMINRPTKKFFIITISPLFEILKQLKENSLFNVSRNYANFNKI
jgi:hypothetical protein